MATRHGKRQEAPQPLEVVRDLVNSWDRENGTDEFANPAGGMAWFARHALLPASSALTDVEVHRIVRLRESFRAVLVAHATGDVADPGAVLVLDVEASNGQVSLGFDTDGVPTLRPAAGGLDGALGRLVATVALAVLDGTWRRLKSCANPECGWAFYDHSRNRSGTWCQMAECGNRAKVKAYRARQATDPG
jgi:predicted RNA-binding Zn ribbon-like protein